MSTNKTTNYNLHSWDGGDYFKRTEINENFNAIDTELHLQAQENDAQNAELLEHDNAIADLSGKVVVQGTAEPTDTRVLWMDMTDSANPVLKRHDGTSWIDALGKHASKVNVDDEDGRLGGVDDVQEAIGAIVNGIGEINARFEEHHLEAGKTITVAVNGTGDFTSLQAAIDSLPKHLSADVRINVNTDAGGALTENISITGFYGGGRLIVDFMKTKSVITHNGYFTIMNNSAQIAVSNGGVKNTNKSSGVFYVQNTTTCQINNLRIDCAGTGVVADWALMTYYSYVWITEIDVIGLPDLGCIHASMGAKVDVANVKGKGAIRGMACYKSAIIAGYGVAPMGVTSNTYTSEGGEIRGTWSAYEDVTGSTGGGTGETPPTSTTVTKTYASIGAGSWRDAGYGWRTGTQSDDVYYSKWQNYGNNKGLWFFDDAKIRADLAGKTIKSIRIYTRRKDMVGNNGTIKPTFYRHNHATTIEGGAEPTLSSAHTGGSNTTRGSSNWHDLPISYGEALRDNTAKGIGLYDSTPSDNEYAIFTKNATLEITFE